MKSIKYISLVFLLMTGLVSVNAQMLINSNQQAAANRSPIGSPNSSSVTFGSSPRAAYMPFGVSQESQIRFGGSRYSAQISEIGATQPRNKYRKAMDDDDPFGGETIDDIEKPLEPGTPIGDALWLLLLLAGVRIVRTVRTTMIRRTEN